MDTKQTPLERACNLVGSQAELARAIGSSTSLVYQWMTGRRPISLDKCIEIERLCSGSITVEELRPDEKNWLRIKDKNWPHPKGRPVLDFTQS
jgi:DNA-binding transcriptional regulator YdaS (Cro superfamily)